MMIYIEKNTEIVLGQQRSDSFEVQTAPVNSNTVEVDRFPAFWGVNWYTFSNSKYELTEHGKKKIVEEYKVPAHVFFSVEDAKQPTQYHKFRDGEWVADTSRKQELITELRKKLNIERDIKCEEPIEFDSYYFLVDKKESIPRLSSLFINAILAMQTETAFSVPWRCDKKEPTGNTQTDNYYVFNVGKALALKSAIETRETTIVMQYGAVKDALNDKTTEELIDLL